jgi:sterol desaturase/sphingolipid hydroxylase (fatty acid hydroxylase superfamily)
VTPMEPAILFLAMIGIQLVFVGWETLAPARAFPEVRGWALKGAIGFAVVSAIGFSLPLLWADALAPLAIADLSGLHPLAGGLLGFVVYEVFVYAWHRAMHASPLLFRVLHQLHHASERLDAPSAWLFHPLDAAGFAFVQSLALTLAGIGADAAIVAGLLAFTASVLQHANVRTPRWLGWFLQRPEAHAVHHERGVHAFNYSDLPILDRLFGTHRDPEAWCGQAGYWDGASTLVAPMLAGTDVTRRPATETGERVSDCL